MATLSSNLLEINGSKNQGQITAQDLLHKLGFTVTSSDSLTCQAGLPEGWRKESQGQFHTVFYGPRNEEVWSFIKYDPWDRHSFLQARNIAKDLLQ